MPSPRNLTLLALLSPLFAGTAHAGSVAGLCPDGSAFVVAEKAAAPCARAKFVDEPSELPPIKPNYLPKPYTWYIEQEARDENNPYNMLDRAQKLRELQLQQAAAQSGAQTKSAPRQGGPAPADEPVAMTSTAKAPLVAKPSRTASPMVLDQDELKDLVQLVALRQQVAPATLTQSDASKREELYVRVAYSPAFESRALAELGIGGEPKHVLLFSARSALASEFYPNFLIVQNGATFRPEPEDARELGFLVGEPGKMEKGVLSLGYLVLPARFDPKQPLEIYWNDRNLTTTLAP